MVLIWAKGAKEYGGSFRLLISMLLEMLFSVLLAPVRMIFHTVFVVSAFLGWSITWQSPQRDDDATPWASFPSSWLAMFARSYLGWWGCDTGSSLLMVVVSDRRIVDLVTDSVGYH